MARVGYCRHDVYVMHGHVCDQCVKERQEAERQESARIAEIRRIVKEEIDKARVKTTEMADSTIERKGGSEPIIPQLKPCPFCGGEAKMSGEYYHGDKWVACGVCFA